MNIILGLRHRDVVRVTLHLVNAREILTVNFIPAHGIFTEWLVIPSCCLFSNCDERTHKIKFTIVTICKCENVIFSLVCNRLLEHFHLAELKTILVEQLPISSSIPHATF